MLALGESKMVSFCEHFHVYISQIWANIAVVLFMFVWYECIYISNICHIYNFVCLMSILDEGKVKCGGPF